MAYSIEVTRWLVGKGVRLADAEYCVQDVFIKMLEMPLTVPPDKLRAFIYRVAMRQWIDKWRRNAKYQTILHDISHQLTEAEKAVEKPDLAAYLKQLKTSDQLLIQKYHYENLSVKEISSLTGYSESKVKTDLHRARKKLKKLLEADGFDSSNLDD